MYFLFYVILSPNEYEKNDIKNKNYFKGKYGWGKHK